MFEIYNGSGEIVDTAESRAAALRLVDYLMVNDRANGPFHCA